MKSIFRLSNAPNSNHLPGHIRHSIAMSSVQRSHSMPPTVWTMTRSPFVSIPPDRSLASGANASLRKGLRDLRSDLDAGAQPAFPPRIVIAVKTLACELPYHVGLPLSRFSIPEIRREILCRGLIASIGETTIWRWLCEDAIRPWAHRAWIFPRDPAFEEKAAQVLDLYCGLWDGKPLKATDCVLSTDEKTSIQARRRLQPTEPPGPGKPMRVEQEYDRMGAWAYLAAWDVRRAKIYGRCERKTGIVPFERLVHQVMRRKPYCCASRVFWIMDNGSSHRGRKCAQRLKKRWPAIVVVHTPVHASWLNQVEIYFSIVQRKALTPNDFGSLAELEDHLMRFQEHYQESARPFQWKFTRDDLKKLLSRLRPCRRLRRAA